MALSSSYDYTDTFTAANLINRALFKLGVRDKDEVVDPTEESDALTVLNLLVKEWAAEGADVWLRDTVYLFLTSKTINKYSIDSAKLLTTYQFTTLSAAAITGASTITVTSATSIANGDFIFIKLSDGTMHSSAVSGSPAGSVVTLATVLPSGAASGASVYTGGSTTRFAGRIESVISARTMSSSPNDGIGTAIEMEIVGDTDFHNSTSLRLQQGRPLKLFHRPLYNTSELNIWPVGGDPQVDRIELVVILPIQDLESTSNNLVLPSSGFNALVWCLAAELASEYGLTEAEQRRLWQVSETKKQNFFDNMVENASVIFEGGGTRR